LASSINKTDHHDIAEILLKVALKHHNPNPVYLFNTTDMLAIPHHDSVIK
jgi:hypothetical protein